MDERSARMTGTGIVRFGDRVEIPFTVADMRQRPLTVLERHTNALELRARSATGEELAHEIYYSVGGGFVVTQSDEEQAV
ncbi:serine dehydratase beta chain, partial [Micrococcus sp. SIMBA_144]